MRHVALTAICFVERDNAFVDFATDGVEKWAVLIGGEFAEVVIESDFARAVVQQ